MAEIFVSYAHEDRDWVMRFSEILRTSTGHDVWWDHNIRPGEQFDDVIERALDGAACVIVVWSHHSVNSRWVKTEAREASRRNILVPVFIERLDPPLEFRSFETADLTSWHGEPDHPDFVEFATELCAMLKPQAAAIPRSPGASATLASPSPAPAVSRSKRPWGYMVAGCAAALVVLAVLPLTRSIRKPDAIIARPEHASDAALTSTPTRSTLPHLTYGTWTLRNAIDDDGENWSNSALKFISQEETPDGLRFRGTFTWRRSNILAGTEEFDGHYVAGSRELFFEGTSVRDTPHVGDRILALGSYAAVLSPDERTIVNGRWGVTQLNDDAGVAGRWEAFR